jgi:formylglycine-generating enzyme required for sulfatase activity
MDATEATRDQFRLVMGWDPSHFHDCAGNCPVTDVSWDNANDFCRLLGKRLPTEAEWEYASRAGARSRWAWGEDEDSAGLYAWYRGNGGKRPHPVGGLRPNAWGLHDMAGNAREWTSDQPTLYASDSTHAAQEIFPGFRIVRGGSYMDIASLLRPTARTRVDSYGDDLGFRCAAP